MSKDTTPVPASTMTRIERESCADNAKAELIVKLENAASALGAQWRKASAAKDEAVRNLVGARRERDEWKDAIIDAAIVNWTYTKEHETNPRQAIAHLIACVMNEALDPAISKPAHDLVQRAEAAERERDEARTAADNRLEKLSTVMTQLAAADTALARLHATIRDVSQNARERGARRAGSADSVAAAKGESALIANEIDVALTEASARTPPPKGTTYDVLPVLSEGDNVPRETAPLRPIPCVACGAATYEDGRHQRDNSSAPYCGLCGSGKVAEGTVSPAPATEPTITFGTLTVPGPAQAGPGTTATYFGGETAQTHFLPVPEGRTPPEVHEPQRTADGAPAHGCEVCDGEDVCSCHPDKAIGARCSCGGEWPFCKEAADRNQTTPGAGPAPQAVLNAIRKRLATRQEPTLMECSACHQKQEAPNPMVSMPSGGPFGSGGFTGCQSCGGTLFTTHTIDWSIPSQDDDIRTLLELIGGQALTAEPHGK